MSQGIKFIVGLLAVITVILIVSAIVWLVATVNQLTKDKDRLDLTTQKLTNSTDELADKFKSLENQNIDVRRDIRDIRKDNEGLNTVIEGLASATGRQISDIKKVIVEQDNLMNSRMDALETRNTEFSEQIEQLNQQLSSQKSSQPTATVSTVKKVSGRVFVDPNNPSGPAGWEDSYIVQLKAVVADEQNFRIDWYKPYTAEGVSPNKPDFVKKTPKFKYTNQLYFFLRLGDADDNRIVGVIDFKLTENKYFPFDLYLDKDRDGDLAEDLMQDFDEEEYNYHVKGIKVFYKDGSKEDYAMQIYTVQIGDISVCYGTEAGRYGVLEANQKKIGILVLDDTGNGLFNDSDDVIFMDLDLDGSIDGSSQANEERPLYSILELPGEKYRVTEIDPAGRHLTLTRMH